MRFLIADDHAIVRRGLVQILREEFAGCQTLEVSDGNEVLQAVNNGVWDVILLDISMPGRNGLETLKQVRANGIKAPILILSVHAEDQYAIRALKAGASGFLNKAAAPEQLMSAVRTLMGGRKFISPSVADQLAASLDAHVANPQDKLSDRELQVLQLIASGKTVSEIADVLSLSINTISTYRARLLEKLALKNNAELTRYAINNNIAL